MYALSLHSITRGYEYSEAISPAAQAPDHRLDNIRLIPHDPKEEMLTSFLGSAARNLDLIDLSTATRDQIRQLQRQSAIIVSHETLRSTIAATRQRDNYPVARTFTSRPQERKFSKEFHVVVVGGAGVDKSALVLHFLISRHVEEIDPTIEDNYRKEIIVDGLPAVVDVLDTTGQEEYSAMREQYIRTGEGFIYVYSITSRDSFAEVMNLHEQIFSGRNTLAYPRLLVANHCERESDRQVSELEGKAMAEQLGCGFIEASSTDRVNIEHVFESIVREIRYHDAVGTTPVKESTMKNALNTPGLLQSSQGDTISLVDEGPEPENQLPQEGAASKRSTSYFRRRLKRNAE
jgi:GTPase KRas protein